MATTETAVTVPGVGKVRLWIDDDGMIGCDHREDVARVAISMAPQMAATATRVRREVAARTEAAGRAAAERAWYSLVAFGVPSPYALAGETIGQGVAARDRLIGLAQAIKGTGSCSGARVVRCADQTEARGADISDDFAVEFSA